MGGEAEQSGEQEPHNADGPRPPSRAQNEREPSAPRRRRHRGSNGLTPKQRDAAARWRARAAGFVLLLAWLIVTAMDALVLRIAIAYASGARHAAPKEMWAWDECGEFFLWMSAVLVPVCVFGLVSAVRLRRLRGRQAALVSALVLFPLALVGSVMCPMLWIAPVAVFVILSDSQVRRVLRPAGPPIRAELADDTQDRVPDDEELVRELRRAARRRVALPAGVMLLVAVFGMASAGVFMYLSLSTDPMLKSGLLSLPFAWALGALGLLWCGFIGYGAWEMDRLGNYWIAKAAVWVAVVSFPVPLYLPSLIGTIAALIALNDPAVRAAFSTGNGLARAVYLEDYAAGRQRRTARRSQRLNPRAEPGAAPDPAL